MKSVLVVSGGGFQGLGLLEALQRIPTVRPIIADIHADNVTRYLCADYRTLPPIEARTEFCSALLRLIEQDDVTTIFPATARELPLLSELADELFAAGTSVAVSSSRLVDTLLDKAKTAAFLRDSGLPSQTPVDPATHDFQVALFGKPRSGWGGTGTVVARSAQVLHRHLMAISSEAMVWFPYIEHFDEFSADFAITTSGQISPLILRCRLRTSGGYSVVSESTNDPELLDLSLATAESLTGSGARGIFNIQLIRPRGCKAFISDVNPRFGTSAVHGLWEGVNLPKFFIDGSEDHNLQARRSVKTVRYLKTVALPKLARRPKGIVFDLDDTLVDHKLWMAAKIQGAYEAVARTWIGASEFKLHAFQLIDEGERSHVLDRLGVHLSWTPEQCKSFLAAYRNASVYETPLFPDVMPVLASLKDDGYRLAVLTDNPPATQRTKIANAIGLNVLDSVICARETGHEKPSPAAYAAAASSLSISPRDLCMVGDNYFRDAVGAVNSGYGNSIVVKRAGTFLQPHAGLADLLDVEGYSDHIHHVENLYALREIFPSA